MPEKEFSKIFIRSVTVSEKSLPYNDILILENLLIIKKNEITKNIK